MPTTETESPIKEINRLREAMRAVMDNCGCGDGASMCGGCMRLDAALDIHPPICTARTVVTPVAAEAVGFRPTADGCPGFSSQNLDPYVCRNCCCPEHEHRPAPAPAPAAETVVAEPTEIEVMRRLLQLAVAENDRLRQVIGTVQQSVKNIVILSPSTP